MAAEELQDGQPMRVDVDGSPVLLCCVVHGPSTCPAPKCDARLRDGQVEVRLAPYEMRGR